MTSMLCDKQPGGLVGVQDRNKVEELLIDAQDHIKTMYLDRNEPFLLRKKTRRPYSTPIPGNRESNTPPSVVDPNALMDHSLKLQDWLNEKSIKSIQKEVLSMLPPNVWPHKKVAYRVPDDFLEKSDLETKATRKLYENMLHVEENFVKEMEDLVNYQELLDLRKKELLQQRWTDRVYQPIRRQVVSEANSPEFDDLFRRKRHLYKQYLEHVNKKGHVFLETFDPVEYYPTSLNPVRPGSITAHTKRLRDPLLSQERERCSEDRVIIQCQVAGSHLTDSDIEQIRLPHLPLVPLGRHGTEATTWVAMPMGDIESPVRLASRRRIRGKNSQIHFQRPFLAPTDVTEPVTDENAWLDCTTVFGHKLASENNPIPPPVRPETEELSSTRRIRATTTMAEPRPHGLKMIPMLMETSPIHKNQNIVTQTSS